MNYFPDKKDNSFYFHIYEKLTEKLKIPRGTPTGKVFRLKGKGIIHLRGYGRGDQIIETVVTVPSKLTKRQEELLREFDRLSGEEATH